VQTVELLHPLAFVHLAKNTSFAIERVTVIWPREAVTMWDHFQPSIHSDQAAQMQLCFLELVPDGGTFGVMKLLLLVSGIHKVCWQDMVTSVGSVFLADLFCAWEGILFPKECLGPGSGHSGSLNAKQSLQEIDGRDCIPGVAMACCSFIAVIYGPAGASVTPLTACCKLTWLPHSLWPSACPSLSLRDVNLRDRDQTLSGERCVRVWIPACTTEYLYS
jgi:hypothetical protein